MILTVITMHWLCFILLKKKKNLLKCWLLKKKKCSKGYSAGMMQRLCAFLNSCRASYSTWRALKILPDISLQWTSDYYHLLLTIKCIYNYFLLLWAIIIMVVSCSVSRVRRNSSFSAMWLTQRPQYKIPQPPTNKCSHCCKMHITFKSVWIYKFKQKQQVAVEVYILLHAWWSLAVVCFYYLQKFYTSVFVETVYSHEHQHLQLLDLHSNYVFF